MRLEEIALSLPCATCGAGRYAPCTTNTGNRAVMPHVARLDPIAEAYAIGYTDAEKCSA